MTSRTLFSLFAAIFLAGAATVTAQPDDAEPPPLIGRIQDKSYVSPTGVFRVEIPVLPELGGVVTDTDTVVTFQDSLSTHISIACFTMDATQRWEHETRGRKDYLIWFFTNIVQADFQQRFPGSTIESAKFRPGVMDGALLTFTLLPGGSMFADRVALVTNDNPPVAKRGNLLFVKNERVFVISMELAEKVLDHSTWDKKPAEEDEILTKRLLDILGKVSMLPPPKAAK